MSMTAMKTPTEMDLNEEKEIINSFAEIKLNNDSIDKQEHGLNPDIKLNSEIQINIPNEIEDLQDLDRVNQVEDVRGNEERLENVGTLRMNMATDDNTKTPHSSPIVYKHKSKVSRKTKLMTEQQKPKIFRGVRGLFLDN